MVLSDGSAIHNLNHFEVGWQQIQATNTTLLTQLYCGGQVPVDGTELNELMGGSASAQVMHGGGGNDVMFANGGADTVFGDAGADYISAGLDDGQNDAFDGGADNDAISYSGTGAVTINLDAGFATGVTVGFDTLVSFELAFGSWFADTIIGSNNNNTLSGIAGDDIIFGQNGNDAVYGGASKDQLFGGDGADRLDGGSQKDLLYGGAGKDVFDFNAVTDSRAGAARDVVGDFRHSIDKIDVKDIDANTGAGGNQSFAFIGTQGFHHVEGELRFQYVGAKTIISGDINGNGVADFQIELTGHRTLTASDFIL